MSELVKSGNEIASLMLANLPHLMPGARIGMSDHTMVIFSRLMMTVIDIGLFNSYNLFTDIYNNPSNYLNGTAPLNVTFPAQACILSIGGADANCTTITGPAADSYLWYELLLSCGNH